MTPGNWDLPQGHAAHPMPTKIYLGDSVYAEYDGYAFIVTTENGRSDDPSNMIVLEPEVLKALNEFVKRFRTVSPTL